jgi:hypothetical protein
LAGQGRVDLRREDYIGARDLDPDLVTSADFQKEIIASFGAAIPLTRFLCRATGALWD